MALGLPSACPQPRTNEHGCRSERHTVHRNCRSFLLPMRPSSSSAKLSLSDGVSLASDTEELVAHLMQLHRKVHSLSTPL